ncbi:MAG: HlyC/CorC family transporter [Pirellulales bacterium]|nr:HlyC/CorC family transporter [Pirellulales bacterium]MBL7193409.1 HlyC/CorC family transporter [Pirellulales bacterium]
MPAAMFPELFIILALILANGFFSGAEMAIVASRRGRLRQLADAGDASAAKALELASSPDRFLPTVQIGITLVGTLAAAYGGDRVVDKLAEAIRASAPAQIAAMADTIALTAFVGLLSYFTLVVGELVPKRLALRSAEPVARIVAPVMMAVATIAKPLVWLMGVSTWAVLFLLRAHRQQGPSVSVDDIEHLLETGRAEGVLEAVEQAVAIEALRLGERTVRDIMRPRIDIDALDIATPSEQVLGAIAMAGYSRLPVYDGSLDQILGYLSIKDVLRQNWMGWPIELPKLLHRPLFVPESMTLDRLLELFQKQRNQLAIVLDEYGGTEGLVTLEDILEELVGEIHDEHQAEASQALVEREDGSWLVDGGLSIDDFGERVGIKTDGESRDYSTIAGLVLSLLERIPSVGDTTSWRGFSIEVVDMDGRRIDRLLIHRTPKEQ